MWCFGIMLDESIGCINKVWLYVFVVLGEDEIYCEEFVYWVYYFMFGKVFFWWFFEVECKCYDFGFLQCLLYV